MSTIESTALRVVVVAFSAGCGSPDTPSTPHGEGGTAACTGRMQDGKALEARGQYAEALKLYEPCFQKAIGRIGMLSRSRHYAPATELLVRKRDDVERLIETSRAAQSGLSSENVTELVELNSWLNEDARSLALFDRFLADPKSSATARMLHGSLWEKLVEARRYGDALRWEAQIGDVVYAELAAWNTADGTNSAARNHSVETAALYVEALVGAKRSEDAKRVAGWVLKSEPRADPFVLLIERSARAGDADFTSWIHAQAKSRLEAAEMQKVEAAIDLLAPSSHDSP